MLNTTTIGKKYENMAIHYLKTQKYKIVERNFSCPAGEIDIIAFDPDTKYIVFVEVKQHSKHSEYERRLRSIDKRKRLLMRRVCKAWLLVHKWTGSYRFDVIEVFGTPEAKNEVEIDHIERVDIFVGREKYVNWCE